MINMKNKDIKDYIKEDYKLGFETNIESFNLEKGLNSNIIKKISQLKEEPEWMLRYRLKAYKYWKEKSKEPNWANVNYPKIDFQNISYFSKPQKKYNSLEEIDPEIIETYNKLGIPLEEQKILSNIAVDAVFDSVSIVTTFKEELKKQGIIFCSISEAIKEYPELVEKYFGSVVSFADNYYASLNAAVFTDGSFVYIPENVKCPLELSTYFRINAINTGQFERTLIIADKNSYVAYNEGCSAPTRKDSQLHAAVVELIALDNAEIKYSTIQNWYPGNELGEGGIYNFVTKRGLCAGENSKISWTQVETGSSITWKYPSCILKGNGSVGEFYSIALTRMKQQADTGTKMIHLGKNTKSTIISKGISADSSSNTFRGLIKINKSSDFSRCFSQCDSLIIGNSKSQTIPLIEKRNNNSIIEHEASTTKMNEQQLEYCLSKGLSEEESIGIVVNGFCKNILEKLPKEFSTEARKLIEIKLEGLTG